MEQGIGRIYDVGDNWTFDTNKQAQEHAEYLNSWGYSVHVHESTVVITVNAWVV